MMNSIRTKLLIMCSLLVLVTTIGISTTYYILARKEKQEESRQRIQIAFEIIRDDFVNRVGTYPQKLQEFLDQDSSLKWMTLVYSQKPEHFFTTLTSATYLSETSGELKKFGHAISADRLLVYGIDQRLLIAYHRTPEAETVGGYMTSQTGQDTYISFDDSQRISAIIVRQEPLPDVPLPEGIAGYYAEEFPHAVRIMSFTEKTALGQRIIVPIYWKEDLKGVLVCEVFYTQSMAARYAALSYAEVNIFAREQLSVGTLPAQAAFDSTHAAAFPSCDDLMATRATIAVTSVNIGQQRYYQGQCLFKTPQGVAGALTVSLSQQVEQQKIRQSLFGIVLVSGIVSAVVFGLAILFSRTATQSISAIVQVIGAVAQGDLRTMTAVAARDEIGVVASKLNQLIAQMRTISGKVQGASSEVNITAGNILHQMESLIDSMGHQSESVDNATGSIEKITAFIEDVARKTLDLLSAAEQILTSIQETRSSISEVTTNTTSLTENVRLISTAVEQVNQAVQQISDDAERLTQTARQTDQKIQHIDQSLQEVAHHATQTQTLAHETMEAATRGQTSVEVSLQGMLELKQTVADTAHIIQEVNTWGERVSAILGIVDEITEQTALLSLNAAIISAQAGMHGRGFAVVADEIKELATRTKASTKEIGQLVHELQARTQAGVKNIKYGLTKADQGIQQSTAVKDALTTILESATRSFQWTADTTRVIQHTAATSQAMSNEMSQMTAMVLHTQQAIQEEERNIGQVVGAVETIRDMAEQVSRANIEQRMAANQIADSMSAITEQFDNISTQTTVLKQEAEQIVTVMHLLNATAATVLQYTTDVSESTVKNLVQQATLLQQAVNVFKVA